MAAAEEERSEASRSSLFETFDEYGCRVFNINVYRLYRSRASVDIIPIIFHLFRGYGNFNPEIQRYEKAGPPILLSRKTLELRFSREKASGNEKTTLERFARYKRVIAGSPMEANKLEHKLGRFLQLAVGLDEDKDPSIIPKIMDQLQSASPDKAIVVPIMHVIYRDTETLRLHRDSRAKLIPATESFIQGLEEMSPPDDDEFECPICMEMFAQRKDRSITKLPCSHYYHRDCIVPWLQINHLCPTCRHPC